MQVMTLVAYCVPKIRFHKGKTEKVSLFEICSLTTTVFCQWMTKCVNGSFQEVQTKCSPLLAGIM